MIEIWKDIPRGNGLYQASNLGRIRSLDRNVKLPEFKVFFLGKREGKILKPATNKNGYLRISLSVGTCSTIRNYSVHRLVAEAFLPNPNNYPCINHKDGNRSNNYIHINPDGSVNPELSNLEWCDYHYNNTYGDRLKITSKKLTNHSQTSKPVSQYTLSGELIKKYPSRKEAERQTGVYNGHISACCLGKKETAGGFKWSND